MRIAFCYNTNAGYESLGIESLSAVLKNAGHEVILVIDSTSYLDHFSRKIPLLKKNKWKERQNEKLIRKLQEFKPQLLCFSVFTDNYGPSIQLASLLKEKLGHDTITIFGGIHATSIPEKVINNSLIDFVMVGESEFSLLQFIDALEGKKTFGEVPNLVYQKGENIQKNRLELYNRDLDNLPLPDKDIFYDKIPALANDYIIMIGRGCPYKCTFCGSNVYHSLYESETSHIRRRSIEHVIRELVVAKEKYQPRLISFVDDIFVLKPKQWLYPFLEEYVEKIDIPYYCQIHPNHYYPDLARKLARSNCWNITMGVQSGSPRLREEYFNRKTSNEDIIDVCRVIKREKLFLTVDIIFGCPSETLEDLDITLELIENIKPSRVTNFYLAYYPNTDITKLALKHNYLPNDVARAFEEGTFINFDFIMKQAGEFAAPFEKHKYWIYQAKMQLNCIFRNQKVTSFIYKILEIMPPCLLSIIAKFLTIFTSLKNYDRRGYQKLIMTIGRKHIP